MENIYRPIKAKIEEIITETSNIKTFVFRPEKPIGFEAGQFMQVTLPGVGECPFTPSSDYKHTETIEFTIMRAGEVTAALHAMREGDDVGLRGPYGVPYPIKSFHGKDVYIIGGGVGLAPLRALLLALFHELDQLNKIEVRFGSRTPQDFAFKSQLAEWGKKNKVNLVRSVDAGDETWQEHVGLVTTVLKDGDIDVKNAAAIVCGPPIMMKFVTCRLEAMGVPDKDIYLSMEKNMSCGVGKCFHCNLGHYLCCKDGPVFTWDKIKHIPDPW